jgi:acyl transferase domain-containing protein/acyl carrier protein
VNDFAKRIAGFSPARLALLCTELQAKLDAANSASAEPIAVVGMACRFPGAAVDLDSYWELLEQGGNAVSEVPRDRWDVDAYYDPDPEAPGKMYTRRGGFLRSVDGFDPQFFNISPREAVSLDPQHRLLLEVAWEALENAGHSPAEVRGSLAGVFVGIGADDYAKLQVRSATPESVTAYTGTGNAYCYGAGRLSFFLGAQGPSFPIDTACSSSLVAAHLACQSLRLRECNLAIVGGVHLMLSPIGSIFLSRAKALAPDGRCKTFDARADGYVRGEGCGVVVFKRLADAVADNDRILALLRGSAVNHDGPSSGFTVPNSQAQQAVIKAALKSAGVAPRDIGYVEVHGTGTPLGDPIELRSLAAVLGRAAGRPPEQPLAIGSVKTNIGHLEPAAGIAGLIKAILVLQHGAIPAHLHLEQVNPHVELDAGPFVIPTALTPWPGGGAPRLAGVSSFGLSGTNAHVIVQEAPPPRRPPTAVERPLHLFTASAKDERALTELAARTARHLADSSELIADICFTANAGRAQFPHRLAVTAKSTAELSEALTGFSEGRPSSRLRRGQAHGRRGPKIAFLFTGQGSQHPGMGSELYERQPTYRKSVDECVAQLDHTLSVPLLSLMHDDSGDPAVAHLLDQTVYAQPALFVLEYALAQLWRSWGVEPTALLGHSVGEYVAACLAGVLSLEDALQLVAARGRLMQALPGGGAMISVGASTEDVERLLSAHAPGACISAHNAPDQVVVSGLERSIESFQQELERRGITASRLAVSHAFHSPLMEPALDELEAKVATMRLSPPRLRVISNVSGAIAGNELATPEYWRRHLRQPVLFSQGMKTARQLGCDVFLEIGPKPVLLGLGKRSVDRDACTWLASLRPGRAYEELLDSAAALYVRGAEFDGAGFDRDYARSRIALPSYPFQRERFWLDLPDAVAPSEPTLMLEAEACAHPVIGPTLQHLMAASTDDGLMTINRRVTAASVFLTANRKAGFFLNQKASSIVAVTYLGADGEFEGALRELDSYATASGHTLTLFSRENRVAAYQNLGFSTTPMGVWQSIDDLRTFSLKGKAAQTLRSKVNSYRNHGGVATVEYVVGTDPAIDETIVALMDDWIVRKGRKSPFEAFLKQEILGGNLDRIYRLFLVRRTDTIDAVILLAPVPAKQGWVMDLEFYRADMPSGALELGITSIFDVLQAEGTFYYSLGATFGTQLGDHPNADPEVLSLLRMFHARNIMNGDGNFVFKRKFSPSSTPFYVCRRRGSGSEDIPQVLAMLADPNAELSPPPVRGGSQPRNTSTVVPLRQSAERPTAGRRGPPLVGERLALATDTVVFELPLDLEDDQRFLRDHLIFGRIVLPAAAYVETILASARAVSGATRPLLSNLALHEALIASDTSRTVMQVVLTPGRAGELDVRVCSTRPDDPASTWTTHASAKVAIATRPSQPSLGADSLQAIRSRCQAHLPRAELYRKLRELGIEYGPAFQTVDEVSTAFGEAIGRVRLPPGVTTAFELHPALLDGCLQIHAAALLASQGQRDDATYLPVGFSEIRLHTRPGSALWSHVSVRDLVEDSPETIAADLTLFAEDGTLVAELLGFQVRRINGETIRQLGSTSPEVFYELRWRLQPRGEDIEPRGPGRWLILADGRGLGAALARGLEDRGHQSILLSMGDEAGAGSEIDATVACERVAAAILAAAPLHGVVHLWGTERDTIAGGYTMDAAQHLGCRAALTAMQTLATTPTAGARLWLVTRGAHPVAADAVVPAQAPQWGLGRTIAQEHPELWGGLIDLEIGGSTDEAERLRDELLTSDGEDQLALRRGQRWVARVAPTPMPKAVRPLALSASGTHLITGGLGGLGLTVAGWMVERGARHLALLGRRGATSDRAQQVVAELQAAGVEVQIIEGDVACVANVASALERINASMPPLCGVVHAAGLLADGALMQQTWERFETVMGPKLRGAWNLHELTRDCPLDYFVVFSSTAALFGSAGQGNYAAANAFLDGLTHHRRLEGLPALSINWGPWSEVGMAATAGAISEAVREAHGIGALSPRQGVEALEAAMSQRQRSQVGVVSINWERLLASSPTLRRGSLFRDLAEIGSETSPQGDVLTELLTAPEATRPEALEAYLCEQVAGVLELDPAKVLRDQPLTVMGFDSLLAIELRQRIERDLQVTVPIVNLFRGDSINEFATYLHGELRKKHPQAFGAELVLDPAELLAQVDLLSDEAVESLLENVAAESAAATRKVWT